VTSFVDHHFMMTRANTFSKACIRQQCAWLKSREIAAPDFCLGWCGALSEGASKYFFRKRSDGKPIKNWPNLPQDDCCCDAISSQRVF
jgi:hypothetical protein